MPDGDDDDYDDDDDYSRVCGESSRYPWKNCAVQSFDCFQNRAHSTAQRLAASCVNCYVKDYTRWKREIFSAQFFVLQFQNILRNKKIDAQGELIRVKKQNFL